MRWNPLEDSRSPLGFSKPVVMERHECGERKSVPTSEQRLPVGSNPRNLATAGSFANCLDFPRILSLILSLYCAAPLDLSVHS